MKSKKRWKPSVGFLKQTRKKQLSLAAIEQQGETDSLRVKYSTETEKQAAQTQSLIKREAAETLRVTMQAEADGMAATIAAENTRSQALHDLELERPVDGDAGNPAGNGQASGEN